MAAAADLGLIGDFRAVESLKKALKDQDKDVRVAAAESLKELGVFGRVLFCALCWGFRSILNE
mgnify:CR=1 FL=1